MTDTDTLMEIKTKDNMTNQNDNWIIFCRFSIAVDLLVLGCYREKERNHFQVHLGSFQINSLVRQPKYIQSQPIFLNSYPQYVADGDNQMSLVQNPMNNL